MAIFRYVSKRGDILPLMGETYCLINIDSQTAVSTSIASTVVSGSDGDDVNNVQANPRTIILDLRIFADVEKTKRRILDVVKIKQRGKIFWQQEGREVVIEGVIEEIEMLRWTDKVMMQITMHCDQPFWEDIENIITQINEAISLHYFTDMPDDMLYFPDEGIPFGEYDSLRTKTFHNAGDVDVGMEIEIIALDTVTNPIIYDADGNWFGCGYGSGNKQVVMTAGDVIHISTKKNDKSVTLNGLNILSKIKPYSTWLQLQAGENQFSINSDDESTSNMSFWIIYKQRYI